MNNVVHFPASDDHVDRFGLEKVKSLAISLKLFLLYAQQNGAVHLN